MKAEHYRKSSAELHSLLMAPIEASLDTSKTLCVIPDKILNYLPFAALLSPAGNYLIQDYDLCSAPSGTLFVTQSAAAQHQFQPFEEKLLLVGDPKFNRKLFSSLRELPASAVECKEVSGLYPKHQLLLRDDATEKKIRSEIETATVGHFAMHFVVNDRSEMLSGFPLTPELSPSNNPEDSNGFLQSYEIYSLKLRRMRLAILSACQTGIERQYHGEGAVGAARPCFVAGVPTVVASLWTVDSDATANLMVDFHKHLRRSRSASQALKRAQLDMIQGDKVELRHPYYWAPFIAIGGISE
jgi:CHAT domain-containing protein